MLRAGLAAMALLSAAGLAAQPVEQVAADPGAPSEAAAAALAEPAARVEEEKKTCRTEKITGSLSRRNRICLTEAQWREVHDRTRRGVTDMQNSASGGKECILDEYGGCRS